MRGMSLFTGSGIGDYAAEQCGIETVVQCETDPACLYCLERLFPDAIRFKDVHDVSAKSLRERGITDIDIISGGFPCQNLSCAGKGEGIEGSRSGLWREMFRVVRQVRPRWILIENVPALRLRGSDRVIAPLERIGYTVWPLVVGAWAVGAPHKRDRVWIVGRLANATIGSNGSKAGRNKVDGANASGPAGGVNRPSNAMADTSGCGRKQYGRTTDGLQGQVPQLDGNGTLGDAPGGREETAQQRGQRDGPVGTSGELAESESERLEGRSDGEPGKSTRPRRLLSAGSGQRWPSRPGQPQHDWESPRLIIGDVGCIAHGVSPRVFSRANKAALRVLGNAWCYQNAIIIYQWITAEYDGR